MELTGLKGLPIISGIETVDLRSSCRIPIISSNNINEFDVCFTLKNKFYVIECKTGGTDKKSDFNQIAYKAKALKETLMGLATEVYIFSLGDVHDRADEMGIKSFGREYFKDKDKFRALMQMLSGK